MSVFFERFSALCRERGETPNSVAKKLGIPSGSVTAWKKGTSPRTETLHKIADYFHVSGGYFLDGEHKESPSPLTQKDKRDIAQDLARVLDDLEHSGDLMFDGVPMSQDAIDSLRAAMKLGLEAVKLKNKATYTPKKYQKPKGG